MPLKKGDFNSDFGRELESPEGLEANGTNVVLRIVVTNPVSEPVNTKEVEEDSTE